MNKRQAKKLQKQRAIRRAEIERQHSSEYFDTSASMTSAVNRINDRIKNAVNHFGSDSKIVQDMYSQIDALVPLQNQRFNAEGVLQIAKPTQLYKDADMHGIIYNMDAETIKPYGDIKAEYQKAYEHYKKSAFYDEDAISDIDAYILFGSELIDALMWAYNNAETPEGIEINRIMSQDKKTYADLQRVIALYHEGRSKYD